MKKFAKLSLVAAVAVAGLTSTVSAADLSEAIKGVNVSGQFRFRAEDSSIDTGALPNVNSNKTDVEVEVGLKVPVTDTVTAVFKIDNANDDTDAVGKANVQIEDYYFSYANAGTTVNFGQQNIPGRLTDAAQGDAIVAMHNFGAFTLGAGAFMTNSVTSGDDIHTVFASGKAGPVSLSAQYADLPDVMDAYNLKADAKVGPVMVGVEYTEKDEDAVANDDSDTLKVYASGKFDALSAKVIYVSTGDTGSGSIDEGAETASEYLLWQLQSEDYNDLAVFGVDATYAINSKLSLRAAYTGGDYKNGTVTTDISETLGQINYKVAKNLNTYFRLSQLENDISGAEVETTFGRIEVNILSN